MMLSSQLKRALRLAIAKSDIYAKHRKKLFEKLKDDIYAHRMFQLMIPEFDLSEGSNINESNVIEWMDKYFKSYAKRNNVDWGILKPYIKWVIIKFSTGGINRWEDIPIRALPDIIKFDKIKKKLPGNQRDINRFKTLNDLQDVVDEYEEKTLKEQLENMDEMDEKLIKSNDIVSVYESSSTSILQPLTEKGSCYLGKGSRWCTAIEREDNAFQEYHDEGALYVIRDNKSPMNSSQLWLSYVDPQRGSFMDYDPQYMDFKDNPLDPIKDIPDKLKKAILEHYFAPEYTETNYRILEKLFRNSKDARSLGLGGETDSAAIQGAMEKGIVGSWFEDETVDLYGETIGSSNDNITLFNQRLHNAEMGSNTINLSVWRHSEPYIFSDCNFDKFRTSIRTMSPKYKVNLVKCKGSIEEIIEAAEVRLIDCDLDRYGFGDGAGGSRLESIIGCKIKTLTVRVINHTSLTSQRLTIKNCTLGFRLTPNLKSLIVGFPVPLIGKTSLKIENTTFKGQATNATQSDLDRIEEITKAKIDWKVKGKDIVVKKLEGKPSPRTVREIDAINFKG